MSALGDPRRGIAAYGESALLVDVPSALAARALAAAAEREVPELLDAVPCAVSVLLRLADPRAVPVAREWALATRDALPSPTAEGTRAQEASHAVVTLDVRYDGADLAAFAAECDLSEAEVVRRHTAAAYTAAFAGFAPGFVYLEGLDPVLRRARRASPRVRVPAGAVAVGHDYTAVYPRAAPGGWHLLGTTAAVMFDAARERPALVVPGDIVRFRRC